MFLLFALLLLVGSHGIPHPIKCMNFYGLETERRGLVCDWQHDPEWYLDALKRKMGINTIRLPFSYEYITNYDMGKMERLIASSDTMNISVILDYHRTWSTHQGPTPEEGITLDDFENAWIHVLERFKQYENIIGVGVFNEIQNNDPYYTSAMHRRVINRIEERFPGRYHYFAGCPNWGGNCENMRLDDMHTWNRTFIEVHKYHFSGTSDHKDWDLSMPKHIPAKHWLVGETGWKMDVPKERAWAEGFLKYLKERDITNICLWTIAHSHDTDGWWKDDCETFQEDKAKMMDEVWEGKVTVEGLPPPLPEPASTPPPCNCSCHLRRKLWH